MVAKLSIANAAAKMTEGFRAIVQDAAHNATLTPSERSHIASPWLKKTIPAKTIQVDDAVDGYIAPKVKSALYSVSSNKTSVTEADVQKLVVAELKVEVAVDHLASETQRSAVRPRGGRSRSRATVRRPSSKVRSAITYVSPPARAITS